MLTREAIQSALPLTEALDERDIFLTPVENTPLASLVRATRSDILPNKVVPTDGSEPSADSRLYSRLARRSTARPATGSRRCCAVRCGCWSPSCRM